MKTTHSKIKYAVSIILMLASSALVAAPYSDNGEGTVTDKGTGLIWQKCSAGHSGTDCATGSAGTYNWTSAVSYCNDLTLAGKSWRLPKKNELKSIVYRSTKFLNIDTTAFPNTVADVYWSASTDVANTSYAWPVLFYTGSVSTANKADSNYVRCVAGP